MVSAILGQITGQLEKRFLLNAFFPTLVFALGLGLVVSIGTGGTSAAFDLWEEQDSNTKVLLTIGAVALVFLLANLLANGMQLVIGLFEGYVAPVRWAGAWSRNGQLARATKVRTKAITGDDSAEDVLQRQFPVYPDNLGARDLAPTRLGNVLLSAETYSLDRYGVAAVRIWPRLYPLLPASVVESLVAARTSMEFLLAVSFLGAIFAPVASIYLIVTSSSLAWVLGTLLGAAVISWAAYNAALGPAAVYGEQVRAALDLYRFDLFRKLGVPMPATIEEERRVWQNLTPFLARGNPYPTLRYVHPK